MRPGSPPTKGGGTFSQRIPADDRRQSWPGKAALKGIAGKSEASSATLAQGRPGSLNGSLPGFAGPLPFTARALLPLALAPLAVSGYARERKVSFPSSRPVFPRRGAKRVCASVPSTAERAVSDWPISQKVKFTASHGFTFIATRGRGAPIHGEFSPGPGPRETRAGWPLRQPGHPYAASRSNRGRRFLPVHFLRIPEGEPFWGRGARRIGGAIRSSNRPIAGIKTAQDAF